MLINAYGARARGTDKKCAPVRGTWGGADFLRALSAVKVHLLLIPRLLTWDLSQSCERCGGLAGQAAHEAGMAGTMLLFSHTGRLKIKSRGSEASVCLRVLG